MDPHPQVFTNKSKPADTQATTWVGIWPDFWEQAQISVNKLWEHTSLVRGSQKIAPKVASFPPWKRPKAGFSISVGFSVWKHIHEWYRIALDDLCFPVNSPTTSVISLAEAKCLVSHLVLQNYSGPSMLGSERQQGAPKPLPPQGSPLSWGTNLALNTESKHCSSHHLTTEHHRLQVKMAFIVNDSFHFLTATIVKCFRKKKKYFWQIIKILLDFTS